MIRRSDSGGHGWWAAPYLLHVHMGSGAFSVRGVAVGIHSYRRVTCLASAVWATGV